MEQAKQFLMENPTESIAVAAKIFNVNVKTLTSSIERGSSDKKGGQNKIMQEHETKAIDGFIRSLLVNEIPPTGGIVFSAIIGLKRAHNQKAPSRRWFRTWWKQSNLHKIKTKPLSIIRFAAAQESDVIDWFVQYKSVIKALKIRRRRNIINFDEAGFRLGCLKGKEIMVPLDIREHYAISPENRRSVTIIEMINAAGEYPSPPMIIIQGHELMVTWFSGNLPDNTYVMTSESGFTLDVLALEYLKHYIKNSGAGPDAEWKIMLMDNHESHMTPEFIALTNDNHISPLPLIPHLTHCMQPLDVNIFKPYKHWHDVAIQEAVASSFIEYSIDQFLNDLIKIRNNTFKASTIRHAFEKSGMWPVNEQECIKQLKHFDSKHSPNSKSTEATLPLLRQTHELADMERALENHWAPKIAKNMQWSDPIREDEFNSFVSSSKQIIANSLVKETELGMFQATKSKELHNKKHSRKRLRANMRALGLTKEDAKRALAEKFEKEKMVEKKRTDAQFLKL